MPDGDEKPDPSEEEEEVPVEEEEVAPDDTGSPEISNPANPYIKASLSP